MIGRVLGWGVVLSLQVGSTHRDSQPVWSRGILCLDFLVENRSFTKCDKSLQEEFLDFLASRLKAT